MKTRTPDDIAQMAIRRKRICQACEHSRDGGFKCTLHKGCCFGKWRTKAASKCPVGRW